MFNHMTPKHDNNFVTIDGDGIALHHFNLGKLGIGKIPARGRNLVTGDALEKPLGFISHHESAGNEMIAFRSALP